MQRRHDNEYWTEELKPDWKFWLVLGIACAPWVALFAYGIWHL